MCTYSWVNTCHSFALSLQFGHLERERLYVESEQFETPIF